MTIIAIPDDLKQAIDKAFPHERLEAVVERLIRSEIARRQQRAGNRDPMAIVGMFDRIREKTAPISSDDIRRLRQEGRK